MSIEEQGGPEAGASPDVRARTAGPWVVRPGVPVVAVVAATPAAATPQPVPVDPRRGNVALCRCGHSDTPPTCDRSHRAVASPSEADASFACLPPGPQVWSAAPRCPRGGVLAVGCHVVVAAGLRVQLADGAVVVPDALAVLCNCGRHLVADPWDAASPQ